MKIILLITAVLKTNKACLFPCLAGTVYLKERKTLSFTLLQPQSGKCREISAV